MAKMTKKKKRRFISLKKIEMIVKDLEQIAYSKLTPYGKLSVNITHKNMSGKLSVTIPVGSTATVFLPGIKNPVTLVQGNHTLFF